MGAFWRASGDSAGPPGGPGRGGRPGGGLPPVRVHPGDRPGPDRAGRQRPRRGVRRDRGTAAAVGEFLRLLERDAPPLARIERVTTRAIPPTRSASFDIAASDSGPGRRRRTLVAADTATCADCLRELYDPADRRFGYPFINCTNCGPRFTIVRDVPYDRPLTTMATFAMCEPCAAEYHDPADRRFHAQPTCCPACGPRLALRHPAAAIWLAASWPGRAGRRDPLAGGGRTAHAGPDPGRERAWRLSPGRRRRLRGGRRAAAGPQAP